MTDGVTRYDVDLIAAVRGAIDSTFSPSMGVLADDEDAVALLIALEVRGVTLAEEVEDDTLTPPTPAAVTVHLDITSGLTPAAHKALDHLASRGLLGLRG